MKLQYIYRSDINRDINGVIKVAEDDEKSMEQELSEYIITKEFMILQKVTDYGLTRNL